MGFLIKINHVCPYIIYIMFRKGLKKAKCTKKGLKIRQNAEL